MSAHSRVSEWDVLKKHHNFVRRDDEQPQGLSWEERAARAYESKLFREYALVDLKHYKSKRFALRWRTATEVVKGIGEDTCASLRCPNHVPCEQEAEPPSRPRSSQSRPSQSRSAHSDSDSRYRSRPHSFDPRSLRAFELPFVYEEQGARKECLVKVRLCRKCSAKLEWKPEDERRHGDSRSRGRSRSPGRNRDRERSHRHVTSREEGSRDRERTGERER